MTVDILFKVAPRWYRLPRFSDWCAGETECVAISGLILPASSSLLLKNLVGHCCAGGRKSLRMREKLEDPGHSHFPPWSFGYICTNVNRQKYFSATTP